MKLITIKSNETPKVGDVAIFEGDKKLFQIKKISTVKDRTVYDRSNNPKDWVFATECEAVNLYVVDETAKIKDEDIVTSYTVQGIDWDRYENVKSAMEGLNSKKIICTNNSSISIPQLTKESIELIISKNGELGEFDIKTRYNIFCKHNCSEYIPKSNIDCEGCQKSYVNIILKENINYIPLSKETSEILEEAAKKYVEETINIAEIIGNDPELDKIKRLLISLSKKLFIQGANWNKENSFI